MFDQTKEVTLDGTLKELQWTNPHIWVQVAAKDPKTGKDVEWSIEGGSPNGLARRGWSRNMMKAGDKPRLSFTRSRTASPAAASRSSPSTGRLSAVLDPHVSWPR